LASAERGFAGAGFGVARPSKRQLVAKCKPHTKCKPHNGVGWKQAAQ